MEKMEPATIRMFGSLYTLRRQQDLPTTLEMPLSREGRLALDIATDLGLPLDALRAIYCNHRPGNLYQVIRPGDRLAFVPKSIPGPHGCLNGFPALDQEEALRKVSGD